jgi:hypothetical protein
MVQSDCRSSTPPRRSRSPCDEGAASQQPATDKGKGRAVELSSSLLQMTGPGYDPYYDDDDSSMEDGPWVYSSSKEAQQYRADEARRVADHHTTGAEASSGGAASTQPHLAAELLRERTMTKAKLKARNSRRKAAAKAEAARMYTAVAQQLSTSAQRGKYPPLYQ